MKYANNRHIMKIRLEVEVEAVIEANSTEAAKKQLEAKLAYNCRDLLSRRNGWRPEILTYYTK